MLMGNARHGSVHRVASILMWFNIRTQIWKAVLFCFFFFVTAVVSFFMIGDLLMYADDRISMTYDDSIFPDEDRTRIVAKRQDGKPVTDQDLSTIHAMRHVVTVDQYDTVNDINYYWQEKKDYRFLYGYQNEDWNGEELENEESIEFMDDSHYMRSSTCIRQEDLAAGRLPEKRGEVVLYSMQGEDRIGTGFYGYLRHIPLWGSGNYVQWKFTVVGILREKTEQIYFSPAMCQMLTGMLNCSRYHMTFYYVKEIGRFLGNADFIPCIGEGLVGDELQVSRYYIVPAVDGENSKLSKDPRLIFGTGGYLNYQDYLEVFRRDSQGGWEEPIRLNGQNVLTDQLHSSSGAFLAMSEEWFSEYNDENPYQAAVYISSYAKVTEVIQALHKAGYEAVSSWQASVREYDQARVEGRLTHIAVALAVLFVTMISEILLLGSLMKLQRRDYYVWRSIGMNRLLMHRMNYYETAVYLLAAVMLAVAAVQYAAVRIPWLHEMCYYYELPGWLCFIFYNLVTGLLTLRAFHRYLDHKIISAIR